MKNRMKTSFGLIMMLMIVFAVATTPAAAQLNSSNTGTVQLQATLPEALTVTVSSGNLVTFNLNPNAAVNAGNVPSVITAQWVLKSGRTAVDVWAFIPVTGSALTGVGGALIPGSAVGLTTTAGANAPTVANGTLATTPSGGGAPAFIVAGGSGLKFATKAITNANRASNIGASIAWNIDTTFNAQLPADTYNGTVTIQAQATP